jgi:hypothetical protein
MEVDELEWTVRFSAVLIEVEGAVHAAVFLVVALAVLVARIV